MNPGIPAGGFVGESKDEILRKLERAGDAIVRSRRLPAELDLEGRFPYELVSELAELGLMGLPIPEEHGGAGGDTVSYAIAVVPDASSASVHSRDAARCR